MFNLILKCALVILSLTNSILHFSYGEESSGFLWLYISLLWLVTTGLKIIKIC